MHFISSISFNTGIDIIIPVLQPRVLTHRECGSFPSDPWSCGALEGGWHAALLLSPPDVKCLPQWDTQKSGHTKPSLPARTTLSIFVCAFCIGSSQQPHEVGATFNSKMAPREVIVIKGVCTIQTSAENLAEHGGSGELRQGGLLRPFSVDAAMRWPVTEDVAWVKEGRCVSEDEVAEEYRKVTLFSWGF